MSCIKSARLQCVGQLLLNCVKLLGYVYRHTRHSTGMGTGQIQARDGIGMDQHDTGKG